MPTSYTSLLGLALPVTGELSGTWGDTVNDYITKYVDASVAGTQTISGSQTAVTLTRANGGALSQAGSGLTGSSQYQIINCTGNPAGTLTVTIDVSTGSPALSNSTYSQTFAVINGTSTSQSVVVRATTTSGTSTGTTLVSGEKALIAWNGSDFIKVATSTVDGVSTISFGSTGLTPSTATSGAVTVAGTLVAANGGTGQSSYTTGDLLYATGSTALSKLGIGTNGQILTSTGTAPQWSTLSGVAVTTFSAGTTGFTPSSATSGAVTLAGTLATTNGGTGLTSFTANGVVYASSTSALTTGSALTFTGANLGVGIATALQRVHIYESAAATGAFLQVQEVGGQNAYFGVNTSGGSIQVTGANPLQFSINGTEQMRLTSTGLGIGTSSPAYKLDVKASGSFNVARFTGQASSISTYIYTDTAYWWFGDGASFTGQGYTGHAINKTLSLYTDSVERVFVGATGNVGIGTSSPVSRLQVGNGTGLQQAAISGGGYDLYLGASGGAIFGFASQAITTVFNTASVPLGIGTNAAQPLIFGTGGTEKMRLDSSGNLGLGVTPGGWTTYSALELGKNGGGYIGNTASGGFIGIGNNFYFNGSYRYANNAPASFYYQQSGNHYWNNAVGAASGTAFTFTQAMTLSAGGNLLVGTTTQAASSAGRIVSAEASGGGIQIAHNNSGGGALYVALGGGGVATYTYTGAVGSESYTERARITSGGNVSIGGSADRGTTVGTAALQLFNGTAPAGTLTNGVSLYSQSGDLRFMDAAGNASLVGYRGIPQSGSAKTGSYTLATTDVGEFIQISTGGSIVIPNSTFAAGDVVSLFNNTSGSITITCSTTNAYIAGTDTNKASMTLATRGVATILFVTSTLCVVSGNVT